MFICEILQYSYGLDNKCKHIFKWSDIKIDKLEVNSLIIANVFIKISKKNKTEATGYITKNSLCAKKHDLQHYITAFDKWVIM